jgi:hypothetical protein
MQALAILALSVGTAVVYGMLHDQVTARTCVEYFTIGHPPIFQTDSPTLLAVGWGILATWWVGLLLGGGLAVAARAGRRPPRDARSLVRPLLVLMAATALCALLAGALGHFLASRGLVVLVEPMASAVPPDRHVPFLTALWAHVASYLAGFVGGVIVMASVWRSRRRLSERESGRGP